MLAKIIKHSILFLIIIVVCAFVFYIPYKEVRKKTIQAAATEQIAVALQASKGIEKFFDHYTKLLSFFAKDPSIIHLDEKGRKIMEQFYRDHSGEISAITRIDAEGRIVYTIPYNRSAIGRDVSYQDHNRMIIATHQPIVSDVFMAVQGYRTVAYAFPVFDGNTYAGSLSLLIPFQLIAGEYLADIKIGKDGYAWMISGKGIQLYTPEKNRIGTDVLKSFSNYPALMELVGRMMDGEEGSTIYEYKHIGGDPSRSEKYHATFVPVRLPNNHWSLAVSVPESELAAPIRAFRNKWLLVMAFLVAAALVLSFYVIRAWWMVEEANRRKAAEKALRDSEAKFRELAELLPQTVFEMDAQGFITYINRHGVESTGYTQEDIANGLYAFNVQVPEDRERAKENFEKMLRGEGKGPNEYRIKRKDGAIFPCMTYTRPIVRDGKVVGARGILVDLTEQKRAEEERIRLLTEIRQTQKMDAIGRLAGGIAHDFNNILNALLGYSELALHKISDRDVVERSLRAIMKAGERARDLVKQILTFSRKAGEDMEPLDPARLLEGSLDFLRASLPSTVEIEHEIRYGAGLIMANPSQFEQVVINLCTNAVHAMNQKGVLKISLRSETITEEGMETPPRLGPGRYVKLSVSDTGVGMDEGTVERIFEPFFTTKNVGKGTGMGLAVVQGIVKSHGGRSGSKANPAKAPPSTFISPSSRATKRRESTGRRACCAAARGSCSSTTKGPSSTWPHKRSNTRATVSRLSWMPCKRSIISRSIQRISISRCSIRRCPR
jgi:PAS domain S-box-containing protein